MQSGGSHPPRVADGCDRERGPLSRSERQMQRNGAPLLSRRPVGDSCLSNQFYCSEPPDVRDAMYQVPPTFLNVHV